MTTQEKLLFSCFVRTKQVVKQAESFTHPTVTSRTKVHSGRPCLTPAENATVEEAACGCVEEMRRGGRSKAGVGVHVLPRVGPHLGRAPRAAVTLHPNHLCAREPWTPQRPAIRLPILQTQGFINGRKSNAQRNEQTSLIHANHFLAQHGGKLAKPVPNTSLVKAPKRKEGENRKSQRITKQ